MTTFFWPKPKENQPGILKIYAFCQKIQQRASGPGEHCWGYISIYKKTLESFHISALKVVATLFSGSRKGAIGTKVSVT